MKGTMMEHAYTYASSSSTPSEGCEAEYSFKPKKLIIDAHKIYLKSDDIGKEIQDYEDRVQGFLVSIYRRKMMMRTCLRRGKLDLGIGLARGPFLSRFEGGQIAKILMRRRRCMR
jgi:hypothetical protein